MNRSNDGAVITEYITIPNGVKVIEVYTSAHITDNTDHWIGLNIVSGKISFSDGNYMSIDSTAYFGVIPNRHYSVYVETATREMEDCEIDRFYIRYSPEINKKTPTVTDY